MLTVSESNTGLVSCACWDNHVSLKLKKSGILLLLMLISVSFGLASTYVSILILKSMPAILPFISQAGGEPPSNGLFAIFNEIAVFFSGFAFILLFVSINHRNVRKNKFIRTLNFISLISIFITGLGLILTSCFPVGYTDLPNKFHLVSVLIEHSLGAIIILMGLVLYQFQMSAVWLLLPDTTRRELYIKMGFNAIYVIFFFLTVYPLPVYIIEQFGPNIFDFEHMKTITYSLPQKYSVVYLFCSFCEWGIVLLSVVNLGFFYKDLQRVSCRIVFRPKSCISEPEEKEPTISLKVIS